ncbi:MAG: cytochrome P450 [Actinobacteria bacterium]|nr:cytochrome P450 [Actinomycetota bacterium]
MTEGNAVQPTPVRLDDPATYAVGPPHEFFTWLRNEAPVYWHASEKFAPGFWVCTRYADVIAIEREVKIYSSSRGGALLEDQGEGTELMMLNQDPPQHTRLRNLVARGFTPKVIKAMEPNIREAAHTIVDRALELDGVVDFVPNFAAELPLVVIAELLGVPYEDRHKIFEWSNRLIGANDPEYGAGGIEAAHEASMELYMYAQSLADSRRARPLDDIVTALVTAELDGEKLSDIEFNVFVLLLSVAGNETTRNLISGGMLALFEYPEQYERLKGDVDGLLDTAVDEMLRHVSPVMYFRRTAMSDTEIRGVDVKAGDKVTVWYGAANRDEDVFPDSQAFDVGRAPNEHIAFGGRGPHYCLGASLAKLEIKVMFKEVLTRIPSMRLAGEAQHLQSTLINGIRHLPVAYS